MNLSVKYRPRLLKQIVGNEKTVSALKSTLVRKDIPHSFLFVGPSGCGKTTLARIVASKLKCSKWDFIENNAADFRGIDHVREIIKQTSLAPMEGDCRVWLLDEAHQLTNDSQHAILKALEDTPSHVYFMLATTEPNKLLQTILTRCVRFDVEPLDEDEIKALLKIIVDKEKVEVPDKVLDQITNDCLGSPRMALSILDRVIGMDKSEMLEAAVQSAAQEYEAIDLCRALIDRKQWKVIASILTNLKQDPEQVRRAVLGYAQAVLLKSGNEQAFVVLEAFREPLYNVGRPGLVAACFESVYKG